MLNRRESIKLMLIASGSSLLSAANLFGEAETRAAAAPVFTWLTLGEVRPSGWIREQIVRDLDHGFAGCLGGLCTEASSDIFVTHRIGLGGQVSPGYERHWWNGETEGNWRAGFIMMSFLTGNEAGMRDCETWVRHILASQSADGYLGAFDEKSRFRHRGELWTQACLLRGLLAYADITGDKQVQRAVQRAADLIVSVYGSGDPSKPWADGRDLGPEGHDLMISDVMERLFEITGDAKYPEFTLWLYEGWGKAVAGTDEARFDSTDVDPSLPALLDRKARFIQHGVHVYEAIRLALWLYQATGRADLGIASRNALEKIGYYTFPSGAAVSQEQIDDKSPDPTLAEYEYCAIKELQLTFESALQKTGVAALGDRIERIWFNAAQGARLSDGKAITYLTEDNRMRCEGMSADEAKANTRNKFSPTHADEAVCCNPNATNVASLYVRGMWMRHTGSGGLAAMLYGPCTIKTQVRQRLVEIEQKTKYPFDNSVEIHVRADGEMEFPIYLRNPSWSRATTVACKGGRIERAGDYWTVVKKWKAGDRIDITFAPEVREVAAVNGEVALRYGALLFAQPIAARKKVVKSYSLPGFEDAFYLPAEERFEQLALPANLRWQGYGFKAVRSTSQASALRPFDEALVSLEGSMVRPADGSAVPVVLVPLGNAPILRRLTFPIGGPAAATT